MKLFTTTFIAIVLTTIAIAQPTITYDIHALKDGIDNPMTLCEYTQPGFAGSDVVWDFSNLVIKKEFIGHINAILKNDNFQNANTALEEFGSQFFFEINKESVQQVGYASKDGRSIVQYTNPFEKMRFPLSYENFYSKNFGGVYMVNGKQIGEITGNGSIEADAWGKLILPNNSIYENTLRIKTTKTYTTEFSNSEQYVEIITYRWYNDLHRYPLLVLTEYKTINGTNENTSYQAAYNNKAVSAIDAPVFSTTNMDVYPNPAKNNLFLKLNSQVQTEANISIYDMTGRKVYIQANYPVMSGENEISLSNDIVDLKPGTYLLNVTINNVTETRELSIME